MKRHAIYFIMMSLWCPMNSFSETKESVKSKQLLNYSVSLGLGYSSILTYDENVASESFLNISLSTVYYPLSWLSFSYKLGLGTMSFYNPSALSVEEQFYFPTEVTRFSIENSLSVEFFGFINNDSLLYLGLGPAYIFLGDLHKNNINENPNYYPDSSKHMIYFKLVLGSRFALYKSTLMDAQMYLMIPFKKVDAWISGSEKRYNQIVLGFEISIGYFG